MVRKVIAALVLFGWGTAAMAHHSFAMFDSTQIVTLSGTVKEFQWTNPHTWIELTVPGSRGRTTQWSIEGVSISALKRMGWNHETFKPGDQVTITINPLKNGDTGGSFVQAKFPDGRTLGRAGGLIDGRGAPPTGAPSPAAPPKS